MDYAMLVACPYTRAYRAKKPLHVRQKHRAPIGAHSIQRGITVQVLAVCVHIWKEAIWFQGAHLLSYICASQNSDMEPILAAGLAANLVFGVAIVIFNKMVVAVDDYDFVVVLTLCHFIFTLGACALMAKANIFVPRQLPWKNRLYLSMVSTFEHFCILHYTDHNQECSDTQNSLGLDFCAFISSYIGTRRH